MECNNERWQIHLQRTSPIIAARTNFVVVDNTEASIVDSVNCSNTVFMRLKIFGTSGIVTRQKHCNKVKSHIIMSRTNLHILLLS